ncbi:hypothetical protein [Staphylospora marina]|nr:hypothetical protein [Staphylospora marina]
MEETYTVDDVWEVIEEFNCVGGESMIWNNDEVVEFDLDTLDVKIITKD